MDIKELHSRFMSGEKLVAIAIDMGENLHAIQHAISTQRKLNPEKWPKRTKQNIIQMFHVYECEDCVLTFAVEQAWDDQSVVSCPVCQTDDYIRDVASGEMLLRR